MQFMTWERQRAYDLDAGREEGIAIGAQQKAIEDAERLLKMNLGTVEQIAEAVDLTVEQILDIKEKIAVKA